MKKQLQTIRSRIARTLAIGLMLPLSWVTQHAVGQTANNYVFKDTVGTFTPLVSPTNSSLANTADDNMSSTIALGFTFNFEGTSYTQVRVSSNGHLVFGSTGTNLTANNLTTTTTTVRPGVAPLWDDNQCTVGIKYLTSGTAPNRTFTAEWLNMEWNYNSGTAVISFQVILYETSNVIEFIYRQEGTAVNTGSGGASIGIMGASSTNYISVQDVTSNTVSTTVAQNGIVTKPATGQVYRFSPPPPCSGVPPVGTLSLASATTCATNFTINQSYPGETGLTYQWQDSLPGGVWTNIPSGSTNISYSAAAPSAQAYYQCLVTCTASTLTNTTSVFTVNPPVINGGNAGISVAPTCSIPGFTLNVTGATTGTLTYQWQDSLPGGAWANTAIATASATNATLVTTANVTTPTYFRRQTICSTSLVTSNSNPVLVEAVIGGSAAATLPVCGDSLTLSLTGNSSGAGITYQWEESTDTTTWSPIFGATNASQKVITPGFVNYYRCVISCGVDNNVSRFVRVRPAVGGTATVTANICLDSATISITGASTGTALVYDWLISTDSINWTSTGIVTATAKLPTPTAIRYFKRVTTCGSYSDTSTSTVGVVGNCGGFGSYSIARTQNITYTSIQSTGNTFLWKNASGDDASTYAVQFPSGFNFTYDGAVRPAFYACTNGWIALDTTVLSTTFTNDLAATSPRLVLAPFWEDLVTLGNSVANQSLIKWEVQGTAPNRVMVVEWSEMERFNYGSPSLNFQVRMYEGSNNIEYVYGRMQAFDGNGTGDFTYSLGMTGNSPAAGQRLSLQVPNTANFLSSVAKNDLPMVPLCNSSYLFTAGGVFNPTTTSSIPTNDSSATPTMLVVNPLPCTDACGTYYTSRNATASNVGPAPVSGNADDDVWFSFVAPATGQVNISTFSSSGYDPAFMVMSDLFDTTGMGIAASRNSASNALESVVASGLISGNTYLIRVFNAGTGFGSTSGAFSICVNEVIPPPANDDTTGAIVLTASTTCTPTAGTTLGATASSQAVCGGLADDDVWFKFIPSASVDTVTVVGSGTFRAHVQVLRQSMTSISCNNTTTNAGTVKVTLTGLVKDSTYFIRVYHTNAGTATANFTICVSGDSGMAPVVTTGSTTSLFDIGATVEGAVVSSVGYPVTASGIVYSTSPNPVIGGPGVVDSTNSPVVTSGNFSRNLGGLSILTTYYYRAYATNALGTSYGPDSTFTTLAAPVEPSITTSAADSIGTFTAKLAGTIDNDGGSAVTQTGVVYSTTPNPEIGGLGVVDSITNPADLSGSFAVNIAGLTHSTQYYFRPYAINIAGVGYGAMDSFTTLPIITTLPYTENFDGATTVWSTSSIGTGSNSWVRGTPAKTYLNGAYSAPNAFVTKLTGSYNGNEDCGIVSPQFDFTTYSNDPILRFKHKFKTDNDPDYDAIVVEISINGGAWTRLDNQTGTGANYNTATSYAWYNSSVALGTLGSNKFNGLSNTYASADVNGWIESATPLTGAAGQANVKIRFRFWADGVVDEGHAIDDIEIVDVTTPTSAASAVNLSAFSNTTTTVDWTNGDGVGRLVVARLTSTTAVAPTNNTMYNASSTNFGGADSTGLGNYIIYKNAGSSVVATGLTMLTDYTYDVYEYNGKYMHVRFAAAASNNGSTLPVSLTAFTATAKAKDALLNWNTASETNNRGFEVERSADGRSFEKVGFVNGAGNSNRALTYNFTDVAAFAKAGVWYYRLKQVDFDGKYAYSNIVKVSVSAKEVTSVSAHPNPFQSSYTVSFSAAQQGSAVIELMDLHGRLVSTNQRDVTAGQNAIELTESQDLKAGVYFVKVTINGESQTLKLVKN